MPDLDTLTVGTTPAVTATYKPVPALEAGGGSYVKTPLKGVTRQTNDTPTALGEMNDRLAALASRDAWLKAEIVDARADGSAAVDAALIAAAADATTKAAAAQAAAIAAAATDATGKANVAQAAAELYTYDHLNDPVAAHAASAISFAPPAGFIATDAQSAIVEAAADAIAAAAVDATAKAVAAQAAAIAASQPAIVAELVSLIPPSGWTGEALSAIGFVIAIGPTARLAGLMILSEKTFVQDTGSPLENQFKLGTLPPSLRPGAATGAFFRYDQIGSHLGYMVINTGGLIDCYDNGGSIIRRGDGDVVIKPTVLLYMRTPV